MKIFHLLSFALGSALFAQSPSPSPSAKHPFTFEDMMALKRVGAPVPSPDGKWVVFDCEDVDLAANTKISHLWIVPASGGESRRLNPTLNHEERTRFSPDGKRLIRHKSGCAILTRKQGSWSGNRIRSHRSQPAPTAPSGRRTGRTSCLCRRCIRIAKMMRATNS